MNIAFKQDMAGYTDMLDIIVMNQIAQKKRFDLSRVTHSNNTKFNNILNQKVSRLNNVSNQPSPFKKVDKHLNITPLLELNIPLDNKGCFETALEFVLRHEGDRLVNKDGASGESSRYGILQSTARSMGFKGHIKDITREQAKAIYEKLWEMSGAAKLPPILSIVYFDTYVNSPAMAKKLLTKSGGDINTFLNMREQRYTRLAERRPDVFGRYLKGWKNRVNNLKAMVAGLQSNDIAKKG